MMRWLPCRSWAAQGRIPETVIDMVHAETLSAAHATAPALWHAGLAAGHHDGPSELRTRPPTLCRSWVAPGCSARKSLAIPDPGACVLLMQAIGDFGTFEQAALPNHEG